MIKHRSCFWSWIYVNFTNTQHFIHDLLSSIKQRLKKCTFKLSLRNGSPNVMNFYSLLCILFIIMCILSVYAYEIYIFLKFMMIVSSLLKKINLWAFGTLKYFCYHYMTKCEDGASDRFIELLWNFSYMV